MGRFVEGEDRRQSLLLPESLDNYMSEDNPVQEESLGHDRQMCPRTISSRVRRSPPALARRLDLGRRACRMLRKPVRDLEPGLFRRGPEVHVGRKKRWIVETAGRYSHDAGAGAPREYRRAAVSAEAALEGLRGIKGVDRTGDGNVFDAHEHPRIESGPDRLLAAGAVTDPLVQWLASRFVAHGAAKASTEEGGHHYISEAVP